MNELVIHPATQKQLSSFLHNPTHAILLSAPAGSGKAALSHFLASELLRPKGDVVEHPYLKILSPIDGKAIGIEAVRELEHFLSLRVPGTQETDRVVIIEDSHLLSQEAQNALLKTLEEPPHSTVLILTTSQNQALLPTIRSRLQTITVVSPSRVLLETHFKDLGFNEQAVSRAYALSGGLPGLMQALLTNSDHPLSLAADYARRILQASAYDRLLMVDELAKQRNLAEDVCFILQQMAHLSLPNANTQSEARWHTILGVSYDSAIALSGNAQPKLVLTNLMLNLS